jgi:group I intron endonuclease
MNCGVYEIRCRLTGHRYIGSSKIIKTRFELHRNELRRGNHTNRKLQHTFNKSGIDNFEFNTIIVCQKDDLLMYEQIAFDALKPEFNIAPTVTGKGAKRTAETVARIVAAHADPKVKAKRKVILTIAFNKPETRDRKIAAAKTAGLDPELKALRSSNSKRLWADPERKEQMLAKLAVIRSSPEYKKKMSESQKARRAKEKGLKDE